MTNNPADAMRGVLRHVLGDLQASLDWRGADGKGHDKIVIDRAYAEIIARGLSAAKTGRDEVIEDTARLDWLDQANTRTNDRAGTSYGWKFDINHNRAALTDHNLPALHVRAAIDEARFKSAPVKGAAV